MTSFYCQLFWLLDPLLIKTLFAFSIASFNAHSFCHNCSCFGCFWAGDDQRPWPRILLWLRMIPIYWVSGAGRDNERSPGLWLAKPAGCWALIGQCEGHYWLLGPHAMDTVSRLCLTHYGKQSACLNFYLTLNWLSNVSQSICIYWFPKNHFFM